MHHPQHLSGRPWSHESPVAETPGLKEKEDREKRWREEVRFGAGVHEMGFVLRWGMPRWARNEEAQHYPSTHIHTLLRPLPPALRSLLHAVLTLLSRVIAHSAKSGHTPPSLAPLFGPLVFGLGKEGAGFSGVYERYVDHILRMPSSAMGAIEGLLPTSPRPTLLILSEFLSLRATHMAYPRSDVHGRHRAPANASSRYLASTTAVEHLLLAFFRAQDAETVR
ncbi:hypothetical protein GGF50DRAFT_121349 [Schizophyllum commune]